MALTKDDVVRFMIEAIRELRPDLRDVELDASTPLWSTGEPGSDPGAIDLDSLDLLEVLIIFEEDHGLLMPDELEDLGEGSTTVGQLADLLLHRSAV